MWESDRSHHDGVSSDAASGSESESSDRYQVRS